MNEKRKVIGALVLTLLVLALPLSVSGAAPIPGPVPNSGTARGDSSFLAANPELVLHSRIQAARLAGVRAEEKYCCPDLPRPRA